MKELSVKRIKYPAEKPSLQEAALLLEKQTEARALDTINWPLFPFRPDVAFRIGHCDDRILLKFYIFGEKIRARISTVNGPVHKDSCVEFFFSPLADGTYYNFEFNCAGTPHTEFGLDRQRRSPLDPRLVETIGRLSSLGGAPFDESVDLCSWDLMLCIPLDILKDAGVEKLGGLRARGNFYKCGDETSTPHYLSWTPIGSERPDFHRYDSFGILIFED